jgi:hypothetical protein
MCTGGAYLTFRHERHLSDASNFHIGVLRGRRTAFNGMLALGSTQSVSRCGPIRSRSSGEELAKGPYVAETFPLLVEDSYINLADCERTYADERKRPQRATALRSFHRRRNLIGQLTFHTATSVDARRSSTAHLNGLPPPAVRGVHASMNHIATAIVIV